MERFEVTCIIDAPSLVDAVRGLHSVTKVVALGELILGTPASPGISTAPELDKPTKAQIKASITDDALISFEDGKPYRMLKRHLMTYAGLTLAQYREKWGLPDDYPSVAPAYSARRSELAKANGLGRKR